MAEVKYSQEFPVPTARRLKLGPLKSLLDSFRRPGIMRQLGLEHTAQAAS